MKTDLRGQVLNVGDTVVIGADNGSSLGIYTVFKLTDKKVWAQSGMDRGTGRRLGVRCRDYDRVVKIPV